MQYRNAFASAIDTFGTPAPSYLPRSRDGARQSSRADGAGDLETAPRIAVIRSQSVAAPRRFMVGCATCRGASQPGRRLGAGSTARGDRRAFRAVAPPGGARGPQDTPR
ncbi:hypothetical protein predicted by Glimmer/Critica [Sorangium cellulosum So ce56]|uniref:Uncharacterized protein n=1 Tax=Sorangium cellulosum (strain So ce56) TaxID=448385 RepID=A9FPX3_SORC5|nr:hypothetical protein predicted by Glimmer/Critica [Sorangium cellulosum So ce56]